MGTFSRNMSVSEPFYFHTAAVGTVNGNGLDAMGFQQGIITVAIIGAGTCTVNFEGSQDKGTTWVSVGLINPQGARVSTAQSSNAYLLDICAFTHVRARISAVAGTVAVMGIFSG